MKENFTDDSKKHWTRIFKKKWFFPTLYLMIAALLVAGVMWYQDFERKLSESLEEVGQSDSYIPHDFEDDVESVVKQKEVIKMPVQDEIQTEIVTKFYDFADDMEDKEQALILYNNRYYQSTGIDIASDDGETFDVVASLSGSITEIKEDPLNGNVIVMSHPNDITTYYASLGQVDVNVGDEIEQGEIIGLAGKNLFNQDSGTHVHFEIKKGDREVNPEKYFNESVVKLEQLDAGDEEEEDDEEEESEADTDDKDSNENNEDNDETTEEEEQTTDE